MGLVNEWFGFGWFEKKKKFNGPTEEKWTFICWTYKLRMNIEN